jgi:hypothetical protein
MISRAERSSRTGMAVIFPIMRATRLRRSSVASGEASRGRRNRSLSPSEDLDEILAWREERTVTQNLTLHYDRMMLILDPTPLARGLVRKKVEVVNYIDGRFAIRSNGVDLPFKLFDKIRTVEPGTIVENKRLSEVLAHVQAQQAAYLPNRRRHDVMRQRPPNNLEAPGLPSKSTKVRPSRGATAPNATPPTLGG